MTATESDIVLERLMSLHPKIIDLTLGRVFRLLGALGNPETGLPPVIHVAGTNGKGSTVAMIRRALEADGKVAHVYTSPHLTRFHERIRVAGRVIPEDDLVGLLDECERANRGEPITYFEITTCAALLAFARTPADYAILEVGLGGRLDATNVVNAPAVSIVTPVSIDHQNFLGGTLAEIAGEKAGILKRNTLAVIAPQEPAAMNVIRTVAEEQGATLKISGTHWHIWETGGGLAFQDEYGYQDLPVPGLSGLHQIVNAGTAVAALRLLRARADAIAEGVAARDWPARMQQLEGGRLARQAPGAEIWLDGGHNSAAGHALAATLDSLPPRSTHLVCGMLNTKDSRHFLEPFSGSVDSVVAVDVPGEAASRPAAEVAVAAQAAGIPSTIADGVEDAVISVAATSPDARILICGSLYLAGHVLRGDG